MQIYFLCPHSQNPVGGVMEIHNMVDTLNVNNISAWVTYYSTNSTDKIMWFEHESKTVLLDNILDFKPDDIIVIPEVCSDMVEYFPNYIKKVIFNQNASFALERMDALQRFCGFNSGVTDMIYVSDHNKNLIKPYFPNLNHHRIHLSIDKNIFNYSDSKKLQLAYMTRKAGLETIKVISRIKSENLTCMPINNMTHSEVAKIFKESLIFLNYSTLEYEGFLLPPAEAMACGCVVVSNVSGGSSEYLLPKYCYPMLSEAHKINMHKMIDYIVSEYQKNPQIILEKGKIASEFILDKYSKEQYAEDVLNTWSNII